MATGHQLLAPREGGFWDDGDGRDGRLAFFFGDDGGGMMVLGKEVR